MALDSYWNVCHTGGMTPLQMLRIGRASITSPHAWTQNRMRDQAGAHCSLGALVDIEPNWGKTLLRAVEYLYRASGMPLVSISETPLLIARWNDTHTHQQVLALWDLAIELAELDELVSVEELIEVLSPV